MPPPVVVAPPGPVAPPPPGVFQQLGASAGKLADNAVRNTGSDIQAGANTAGRMYQNEGPVGRAIIMTNPAISGGAFLYGAAQNNICRGLKALGF